jgi:hypothetical protein
MHFFLFLKIFFQQSLRRRARPRPVAPCFDRNCQAEKLAMKASRLYPSRQVKLVICPAN